MEEEKQEKSFRKFYNKNYKIILILPLILFLFSVGYLFSFYLTNHDFVHKDFSLTGGTSITLNGKINADDLKNALSGKLDEINTRVISDLVTREQIALIVETKTDSEIAKSVIEDYLGYALTSDNSSIEFIGPALGQDFYKQLVVAILFAFAFMAIVVFVLFRTMVPSAAVIISALADILMTLVMVDILGIKMSSAGIVAFLMLIGYSVDTDILLTSRILKRTEGSVNDRLFNAFKTGIMMTLTSLLAIVFALFIVSSFSAILTQIFTVLTIGLCFDLMNTWITNASILKRYVERRKNEN